MSQIQRQGNRRVERIEALRHWLVSVMGTDAFGLSPASNDASFRRYFRVRFDDGRPTLIVMDAPPEREDCRPFVHVAELFAAAGVQVPAIHSRNFDQGFLLLSDLGDTTYLAALAEREDSADRLYGDALDALVRIQLASRPAACADDEFNGVFRLALPPPDGGLPVAFDRIEQVCPTLLLENLADERSERVHVVAQRCVLQREKDSFAGHWEVGGLWVPGVAAQASGLGVARGVVSTDGPTANATRPPPAIPCCASATRVQPAGADERLGLAGQLVTGHCGKPRGGGMFATFIGSGLRPGGLDTTSGDTQ